MTRYIIPGGGLCNRLRVIKSSLEISGGQSKVIVFWRVDSELGSKYEDLFDKGLLNNNFVTFKNIEILHPLYWILHPKFLPYYKSIFKLIGSKFKIFLENDTKAPLSESTIKDLQTANKALIHSYHCFYPFKELHEFMPVKSLQDSVDSVTSNFNKCTIGIHIRRTDNKESIRLSPTSLFVERMQELISMNAATNFFLCTDDLSVKKELKDIFKDNLYTRDISYDRSKGNAISDAVVDLYSLSKTRYLLCSHYSSFSEMATIIGYQPKKVEVVIAKVENEKFQTL